MFGLSLDQQTLAKAVAVYRASGERPPFQPRHALIAIGVPNSQIVKFPRILQDLNTRLGGAYTDRGPPEILFPSGARSEDNEEKAAVDNVSKRAAIIWFLAEQTEECSKKNRAWAK